MEGRVGGWGEYYMNAIKASLAMRFDTRFHSSTLPSFRRPADPPTRLMLDA